MRVQDTLLAKTEAQIVNDVTGALAQFQSTQRRVERAEHGLLDRARRTRDWSKFSTKRARRRCSSTSTHNECS